MFAEAAKTLAGLTTEQDLATGSLFPPLAKIREVSAHIAAAVAGVAYRRELATESRPADLLACARAHQYQPVYKRYI
jgi:malate dehydrogenase (oxaloacetate-decarboxylating)(NADP+)